MGAREGLPNLGSRLDYLFANVPREDGGSRLHSNGSLASALTDSGIPVSEAHVSNLRNGKADNPSAVLLHGISSLFRVPVEYFFDGQVADQVSGMAPLLAALQNSANQGVLLRSQGLDSGALRAAEGVLDVLREAQGLPPVR